MAVLRGFKLRVTSVEIKTERDEAALCVGHQTTAQSHTAQWDGGENSKGSSEKTPELVAGQVT